MCNAAESLVVHAAVADVLLPRVGRRLSERGVEIRGDERTLRTAARSQAGHRRRLRRRIPRPDHLLQGGRLVGRGDRAHQPLRFAAHRGDRDRATWTPPGGSPPAIDSSAVMINASTRFNDGGEFGLGAEIGISTDKFHARGPCGINELTSYKYVVVWRWASERIGIRD